MAIVTQPARRSTFISLVLFECNIASVFNANGIAYNNVTRRIVPRERFWNFEMKKMARKMNKQFYLFVQWMNIKQKLDQM